MDFEMTTVEAVLKQFAMMRRVYAKAFTERFVEDKFSPNEVDILIFLSRNPSINTSKQMCMYMDVSKALICRSIDSLVQKKLVVQKNDPEDRRVLHIELTKAARPVIDKVGSIRAEIEADILSGISEEEIAGMQSTLQKIIQRFKERSDDNEA